jgi:hypothetical protein
MVTKFQPQIGRAQYRGRVALSSEATFGRSIKEQMDAIVKNFASFFDHLDHESGDILLEALKPTFEKSQEYVPVQGGRLKGSGYLEKRQIRGHTSVEIGYARGGNPNYAVFVHENLAVFHAEPTRAKFLQSALEEDAEAIKKRIQLGYSYAAGLDEPGGVWHG